MAVYPGFGLTYKNTQVNWAKDIAFFNSIGISSIRPHLPGFGLPWSIGGNPNTPGTYANWRLCAQTFANAGFFVTWGATVNTATYSLTSSSWQAYHDSIVAEATYLQSQGTSIEFEVGNELGAATQVVINSLTQIGGVATAICGRPHSLITGDTVTIQNALPIGYQGTFSVTVINATTYTFLVSSSLTTPATNGPTSYNLSVTQLNTLIRQLASDVKAVYTIGTVSYATDNFGNSTGLVYDEFIANGIGSLDTISVHPYGLINVATQTVVASGFPSITAMISTFGPNACYISEFNLDSNASRIYGLHPPAAIVAMTNLFNTYILGNGFTRYMLYAAFEFLNNTPVDIGYAQILPNDYTNPMFYNFFASKPTQYARTRGSSVTRTTPTRGSVTRNTAYLQPRPVFNNS